MAKASEDQWYWFGRDPSPPENRRLVRIAGLALCLLLTGTAHAQQERMAQTPHELAAAINASGPGDTVVMANGTWTDVAIDFFAEGVEGDTITLRAETPGQVVLDGRSRLRIGGQYLKVDGLWFRGGALTSGHVIEFRRSSRRLAHHSRLTNCAVTDYNPPSRATEYKWVSVYGTHNRVDHCHFSGKDHDGATVVIWLRDPPDDSPVWHRVDRNHFGHRPELGKNGGESLRIGTSSRSMQDAHVTVEQNLFQECDGEIEIISNKSGHNTFRHNTFRRSSGVLTLRHGNDASVYGNYFLGEGKSGSGGVRIIGERHRVYNNYFQDLQGTGYRAAVSVVNGVPNSPLNRYFQVRDAVIAFNTFVNVRDAIVMGAGKSSEQSLAPDSIMIANNVVTTIRSPIISYEDPPLAVQYLSNVFHGAPVGIPETDGISTTDPQLDAAGDFWRPAVSSPVVGTATQLDFVHFDIDGQSRDASPDIGADEVASGPILYPPLLPQDVGPPFLNLIQQSVSPEPSGYLAELESYPHPFRASTTLTFEVLRPGHARLVVYDLLGREIVRLVDGHVGSGLHSVRLAGTGLAPGAYLAVLDSDGPRRSRTIIRQ